MKSDFCGNTNILLFILLPVTVKGRVDNIFTKTLHILIVIKTLCHSYRDYGLPTL